MWWWNEEVQKEIKEKKEAKKRWDLTGFQEDMETYKMRKKNAKRAVARAKAKAIEEAYEEIKKKNGERQILRIARDRASKDIASIKQMKDTSGVVLREDDKIRSRWKEYFYKLLNEENPRGRHEDGEASEGVVQDISKVEVEGVLRKMKNGKAVGVDQIPAEVWKSLGREGVDALWDLMKKIAQQERIPEEWKNSILVPFHELTAEEKGREMEEETRKKLIKAAEKEAAGEYVWQLSLSKIKITA
ncbi:hypothetical protein J437_LFUL008839 [Ladona fulva]|uniref:Uncharacterized protein n=1 Tax=Ladona fulva TaxID=123851 RepID=A0A8K0P3K3_LADFU|nr:hypothetical protein J437_LFUL008839 [Ladona fulva]